MTLEQTVAVPGMLAEYRSFSKLIRGLSDNEWSAPSRCAGWAAADVAAHVTGQLTDVVNFRLEGIGTPEVTERQVMGRRNRPTTDLADELDASIESASPLVEAFDDAAWNAPGPAGTTGTLGDGIEALWFDTYLHADDIRNAAGRPSQKESGLLPSLSHLASVLTAQGWGPAELSFAGLGPFFISGGSGPVISGDPFAFVLCSTGRGDPAQFGLDESVNIYR